MSDWTKQTEQFVNTWTSAQKDMWDNWLSAAQTMSKGVNLSALEAERQKVIDSWEASVKKGLEAQAEWAKMWADTLADNKNTPKPMLEWAKQMHEMMKSWSASQEQLSHVWFEMVKKMDSTGLSGNWENQGAELMKAWQDAAQKALEAQQNMSKYWADASATAQKSSRKS